MPGVTHHSQLSHTPFAEPGSLAKVTGPGSRKVSFLQGPLGSCSDLDWNLCIFKALLGGARQ